MIVMRLTYWGLLMILLGFILFIISIYSGSGGLAVFIVFPVFYSTGVWGMIAGILIFVGFILIFLTPFYDLSHAGEYGTNSEEKYITELPAEKSAEKTERVRMEKHYGGVILIGPVPIIFGSDKNMVAVSILAAILTLIAIGFLLVLL